MTIANHGAPSEHVPLPLSAESEPSEIESETSTQPVETRRAYGDTALRSLELPVAEFITLEDIRHYAEERNVGARLTVASDVIIAGHANFERYERHVAAGLNPGSFLTTLARQWEFSGIDYSPDTGVVALESLARSVESADFYLLPRSQEVGVKEIVEYIQSKGRKVDPPLVTYFVEKPYLVAAKSTENLDFLSNTLVSARENTDLGRCISGPYKPKFDKIMEGLRHDLEAISPNLPMSTLMSHAYRSPEAEKAKDGLDPDRLKLFYKVYNAKPTNLADIAKITWEEDEHHLIPEGLLDTPEYNSQIDSQQCVAAAFRMIYESVTGKHINEEDLAKTIKARYGAKIIDDREYLKIFETDLFKRKYGNVQSFRFSGMNLETIGNVTTKIKAKRPGSKVFAVVNLDSDTSPNNNTQHRAVLLGADEDVLTHDPHPRLPGMPYRRTPKDRFCRSWAKTQNTGYLVVAA